MPKSVQPTNCICLRKVRHHNLKKISLDLPLQKLVVLTGPSGSGKSTLAFDTLYAEGQRRYIETFSPYARQFFERMDKPQADSIQGIPPAIAIEQCNSVKTTRSTVGTMTEIADHMKLLWTHFAKLFCRRCGQMVRPEPPPVVWEAVQRKLGLENSGQDRARIETDLVLREAPGPIAPTPEALVLFRLPFSDKMPLAESLALIAKQGYQRLFHDGAVLRLEDGLKFGSPPPSWIEIVQDRIRVTEENRARFIEALEQAYHFGQGKLSVFWPNRNERQPFSLNFHCARCDLDYRQPSPALFSFNNPLGACPACRGFGRTIQINYDAAIPDRSRTLGQGAVKPWLSGSGAECQQDLLRFCRKRNVPTDVPFGNLPNKWQDWVLNGDPGYGQDSAHQWPRAWYGVKGYFRWLESKSYKMHVRVLLSRYRIYRTCPDCGGTRFQPDALLFKIAPTGGAHDPGPDAGRAQESRANSSAAARTPSLNQPGARLETEATWLTLADFYRLPVSRALEFVRALANARAGPAQNDPGAVVLGEVISRLQYLEEVGLGYLSLDRPTRTLSGGETERVNLTTCLGSRLVNTLFVLDEPSVGLHPRDTERLIRILKRLRDQGNSLVVVEHEPAVIAAADHVVDLGPGHGESGGQVVFEGTVQRLLECRASLTGQYLSGDKAIAIPKRRPVPSTRSRSEPGWLRLVGAALHNLKNLSLDLPLGRLVCVTGVSGSGKTTLIRDVLWPLLQGQSRQTSGRASENVNPPGRAFDKSPAPTARLDGGEQLSDAIFVDQSSLGRTPRSNPAVYIGAFDSIRALFEDSQPAKQHGLKASAFSFNSTQGQCERCRGAGFEKIEMQFLSDVYIPCPDCGGRRYRPHLLEIRIRPQAALETDKRSRSRPRATSKHRQTIAAEVASPAARRAPPTPARQSRGWNIAEFLEATVDEAVEFLGHFNSRHARNAAAKLSILQQVGLGYLPLGQPINTLSGGESQRLKLAGRLAELSLGPASKPSLFIFDEPTTGLHFDDVRVLIDAFQRLVESGHSVLVIEHNLELVKCADWIIDLGPEAGDAGGELVASGPPEAIAACPQSHTGHALRQVLPPS